MNTEHARRVYDFQDLQRRVLITAVLERYGLLAELKRTGTQLKGRCPIHKGTNPKQFVVDPHKNVWRCFGDCDRGGSTLDLVSCLEGIEIRQAAEQIASWFSIAPSRPSTSQHEQQRRKKMSSGERPSHKVFVVEDRGEDKAFWHRVGSAWPHSDGKGLNIQLPPGLSVSGRVSLREYTDEDAVEDEKKKVVEKKRK